MERYYLAFSRKGRDGMNDINVGVIGLGKMGLLHSAIFNQLNGCNLTALCDTNEFILRILKNSIKGVEVYSDYQEMIECSGIDLVVITTPVFLHEVMAEKAIKAGIDVFIEKPLARTSEESNRLALNSSQVTSLVGYCRRFMPTYKKAQQMVNEESLGKVISFQSHMLLSQAEAGSVGWQYDPIKSGGGALVDIGCHAIDLIHFVLGSVNQVNCQTSKVVSQYVEDCAKIQFSLNSGISGKLLVSWCEPNYRLPELLLDIQCENGHIRATEKYIELVKSGSKPVRINKQLLPDPIPLNIGGREYTSEGAHLIECIHQGRDTDCNIIVGGWVNSVIDAAYASARTGLEQKVIYNGV